MTSKNSATERLEAARAVLARVGRCPVESLAEEHELVADLGVDSARALQLLAELEDALDLEIADEDAARLNTVGDVLDYVRGLDRDA